LDWLAIAVIINNYLHDMATGILVGSAILLWVLIRQAKGTGPEGLIALERAYPTLRRFAIGALAWIVVGGIPRVIFFADYEWDPAVIKGIVPALAVKHVMLFAAVFVGAVMWRRAATVLRSPDGEALER
jgi:hypothetical protein